MAKLIKAIVKRDNDGDYHSYPFGIDSSNVKVDIETYDPATDSNVIVNVGDNLNEAFANIIDFIEQKVPDNWVYQYGDDSFSHDFIAHKGNEGQSWKNDGDIILYPNQGGATFGTTGRVNQNATYDVLDVLTNKQSNSLEIGNNNSAVTPQNGSAANSVVIGDSNTTEYSNTLLAGRDLTATRDNQLIIGERNNVPNVSLPIYSYKDTAKSIDDMLDGTLTYNSDAVLVVASGDNNQTGNNEKINALEVYDMPDTSADGYEASLKTPNSVVHTSGDLLVDGNSTLNDTFVRSKLYTEDLYVLGSLFVDAGDEGEDVSINASDYKKIVALSNTFDLHTHDTKVALTGCVPKKQYREYGKVTFKLPTLTGFTSKETASLTDGGNNVNTISSTNNLGETITDKNNGILLFNDNSLRAASKTNVKPQYYHDSNKKKSYTASTAKSFITDGMPFDNVTYDARIDEITQMMDISMCITLNPNNVSYSIPKNKDGDYIMWNPVCSFNSNTVVLEDGEVGIDAELMNSDFYFYTSAGGNHWSEINSWRFFIKNNTLYLYAYGNKSVKRIDVTSKTQTSKLGCYAKSTTAKIAETINTKVKTQSKWNMRIKGSVPISSLNKGVDRYVLNSIEPITITSSTPNKNVSEE